MTRVEWWKGALLAAGLVAAMAGCGSHRLIGDRNEAPPAAPPASGTQGAGDRLAPSIGEEAVMPESLRFAGGPVRIQARVTDDGRVQAVWADVGGASVSQRLPMMDEGAGLYACTWTAPVNPSETGAAVVYGVSVGARDAAGNTAVGRPQMVTVNAIPVPPASPGF